MTADLVNPSSNRAKWMALTAALLGWMFDGVEMGLFPFAARPALQSLLTAQGVPAADLNATVGSWMGTVTATFLIGAAFGGLVFGWLGDRFGRVRAMTLSVLVYSLFSALGAAVQDPAQLAGTRFLASLGMGGEWALGVALVMEVWPADKRPLLAGLIGAIANVGFLLVGVLGKTVLANQVGIGDALRGMLPANVVEALMDHSAWRLILVLGALPAVLTLFIQIFVPESERWKEAAANSPKNRITDLFLPGVRSRVGLGIALASVALIGTWGTVQQIPAWTGKMAGPQAAGTAQICSGFGAALGCVIGALMAQWTSRRWTYFSIALLSLISAMVLYLVPMEYGGFFLVMVFLVGGITASFYGWLPLYLPELFPTRIRATAVGTSYNSGRILAAVGALGAGAMLKAFNEDYAKMGSVLSLIYVIGLLVIWFCPETKGKDLPE
jgi:MFS family permease